MLKTLSPYCKVTTILISYVTYRKILLTMKFSSVICELDKQNPNKENINIKENMNLSKEFMWTSLCILMIKPTNKPAASIAIPV